MPQTDLMNAVENGNLNAVKQLLEKKVNVNVTNNSYTALMIAAYYAKPVHDDIYLDIVDAILQTPEVNIHHADYHGRTALITAVTKGHLPMVKLLLNHGANVNHANTSGMTALMIAVQDNSREVIAELLKVPGINVNTVDCRGNTTLNEAIQRGNDFIVDQLLSAPEVNVNFVSHNSETPLIVAVRKNSETIVEKLLAKSAHLNLTNAYGETPLICAAKEGLQMMVRQLLNVPGVAVNHKNKDGDTALICAAKLNHLTIVDELLEAPQIKVNLTNSIGHTALTAAAINMHDSVVERLLKLPEVSLSREIILCFKRQPDRLIEILKMSSGLDLNEMLIYALDALTDEIIEPLYNLTKTQNVRLTNGALNKLLIWALIHHRDCIIEQLIDEPGVDFDDSLMATAKSGNEKYIDQLLLKGADVNFANTLGDTALITAAKNGHVNTVKKLLTIPKVNVNHANTTCTTALSIAIVDKHQMVLHELLGSPDLNVNLIDKWGNSPLTLAVRNENLNAVKALLDRGAHINYTCSTYNYSKSALMCAAENGYIEIVDQLLKAPGVNVNLANKDGATALYFAIRAGKSRTAAQLIKVPGVEFRSTLLWAVRKENDYYLQIILSLIIHECQSSFDDLFQVDSGFNSERIMVLVNKINNISNQLNGDQFKNERANIRSILITSLKSAETQLPGLSSNNRVQLMSALLAIRDQLHIIQSNDPGSKKPKQKTAMKKLMAFIKKVHSDFLFEADDENEAVIEAVKSLLPSANSSNETAHKNLIFLLDEKPFQDVNAKSTLLRYLRNLSKADFDSLKVIIKQIIFSSNDVNLRSHLQKTLGQIFNSKNPNYDAIPLLFILRTGQGSYEQKDTASFKELSNKFKPSKLRLFTHPSKGKEMNNQHEPLPGLVHSHGKEDL